MIVDEKFETVQSQADLAHFSNFLHPAEEDFAYTDFGNRQMSNSLSAKI